jgi:hypothetical protein
MPMDTNPLVGNTFWPSHHTGPLERLNNKIKTMKRKAYGFRDIEFFKLKIKAIRLSRYALVG